MINLFKISRKYIRPILHESDFYGKLLTREEYFVEFPEHPDKNTCTPVLVERFSSEALTPTPRYFAVYWVDFSKQLGNTVIDLLNYIRENLDSSLNFRQSCQVGLCGICSMNINGKNTLACITPLTPGTQLVIRPLTQYPVIHDLVVDLDKLYQDFHEIRPWLISSRGGSTQSEEARKKLEKFLPCSLCGCCNASSPAYWWNKERYYGPAVLMQAYRWIADSRDQDKVNRVLDVIDRKQHLFETIEGMGSCPIGLDPEAAVVEIKREVKELERGWDSWVEFGGKGFA